MNKGWISINRKVQEHWLWQEKREFSKLEAWFDILLTVNYSEQKVMIKNTLFTVKRGQSINSQLTWGNRWNWNRNKVRRFLELLQKDEMIELNTSNKTTILTVCKYDSYQDKRTSNEHQMNIKRTSNEHQTNTNNKDNNINNDNNENKKEIQFKKFWDLYGKKVDSQKCKKKFLRLSEKDINKIFEVIKDYINSTPDVKYRKNPLTWLNGECWKDEIIKKNSDNEMTAKEKVEYMRNKPITL